MANQRQLPIEFLTIGTDLGKIPQEIPTIIEGKDFFTKDFYQGGIGFTLPILQKLGLEDIHETEWRRRILIESAHPYILDSSEQELNQTLLRYNGHLDEGAYFRLVGAFRAMIKTVGGESVNGIFIDDVHFSEELVGQTFEKFIELANMKLHIKVENGVTVFSKPITNNSTFKSVSLESHYINPAHELISRIINTPSIKIGGIDRKHIKIAQNKIIYLYEKGSNGKDSTLPSCEFLDLAYQLEILQEYDGAVILLPLQYKTQQERVNHLKTLLNLQTNIVTLLV